MILFTADIHLKLGQKNVPVDWAKKRYQLFFQQVYSLEAQCSMHIVGGDLFDRLPTMEELELYFDFLKGISIPTLIYPGNHEATKKNKTFFSHLKEVTKAINPLVAVVDECYIDENLGFGILPYSELHKPNSIEYFNSTQPLFTHVRGEIPPHVKPEVDLSRFDKFPVVFAGDLHSHSNSQKNIVYPGSPMTTSFHRNEVSTGYLLINEADWSWVWKPFNLPQLLRKTIESSDEMVSTDFHHTIYEIEGDLQELASVENNELLDKKIVKRNREAALVLNKEYSLEEELVEYLKYILELDDKKVENILGILHDYTSQIKMG